MSQTGDNKRFGRPINKEFVVKRNKRWSDDDTMNKNGIFEAMKSKELRRSQHDLRWKLHKNVRKIEEEEQIVASNYAKMRNVFLRKIAETTMRKDELKQGKNKSEKQKNNHVDVLTIHHKHDESISLSTEDNCGFEKIHGEQFSGILPDLDDDVIGKVEAHNNHQSRTAAGVTKLPPINSRNYKMEVKDSSRDKRTPSLCEIHRSVACEQIAESKKKGKDQGKRRTSSDERYIKISKTEESGKSENIHQVIILPGNQVFVMGRLMGKRQYDELLEQYERKRRSKKKKLAKFVKVLEEKIRDFRLDENLLRPLTPCEEIDSDILATLRRQLWRRQHTM